MGLMILVIGGKGKEKIEFYKKNLKKTETK